MVLYATQPKTLSPADPCNKVRAGGTAATGAKRRRRHKRLGVTEHPSVAGRAAESRDVSCLTPGDRTVEYVQLGRAGLEVCRIPEPARACHRAPLGSARQRIESTLTTRSLRSVRELALRVARQPENVIVSSSRVWALPPLHSRHPPALIEIETVAFLGALCGFSDRHRQVLLLPLASPPGLPAPLACDRDQIP